MPRRPIFDDATGQFRGTFNEDAATLWVRLQMDLRDADSLYRIGVFDAPAEEALYRTAGGWVLVETNLIGLTSAQKLLPEEAATWLVANALPIPDELATLVCGIEFAPGFVHAENQRGWVEGLVRFSSDFRSCRWGTEQFTFTAQQAACIRVLWESRQRGTPDLSQITVLAEVESAMADSRKPRLRDLFRKHPAWGTMIVKGLARGTYRLADPLA